MFAILAGGLGRHLPTSFVPEEDYGYFLLNVQLPNAASLQRTDDVCRKVEAILSKTEGLNALNAIIGFSLLTRVTAPNNGFYFVGLKPWSERHEGMDARSIVNRLNARFREEIPEAFVLAVMPPSIPGLGSQGGFTFWLQDRTGGTIGGLDANLQKFLTDARKRPELAGVTSPFSAAVPQVYVDVDRDKVLKEGIALTDVYQTMQTFLGGLYVNQFNRFGRQWRVFMQAEGQERTSPESIGQFYVRNNDGNMVPMSSLQTHAADVRPAVHEPVQRVSRGADHRRRGARVQLRAGARRAGGGCQGHAAGDGELRLVGPVVSGAQSLGQRGADLRPVDCLRVPDSRGALRELVAAVLGAAVGAGRGRRRVRRPADAASTTSTSTRRSASSC